MKDYVMIYYIHTNKDNPFETESGFKKGSSPDTLQKWAEENNIDDYQIYLSMWEVQKYYIDTLDTINRITQSISVKLDSIDRLSK